jgi:hypothetical protein
MMAAVMDEWKFTWVQTSVKSEPCWHVKDATTTKRATTTVQNVQDDQAQSRESSYRFHIHTFRYDTTMTPPRRKRNTIFQNFGRWGQKYAGNVEKF